MLKLEQTKYCKECGKPFEATHGNQKLCSYCRYHMSEIRRKKNIGKVKDRKKKLGIRASYLYNEDIDLVKKIKNSDETIADVFHKILYYYMENKGIVVDTILKGE